MRVRTSAAAAVGFAACQACSIESWRSSDHGNYAGTASPGNPTYVSEPSSPEPPACVSGETWSRMSALHDETELSVHELVKCGGLQTRISRTILVIVVASNRELFDAKSYAELVNFAAKFGIDLGVPLNRAADGAWTMPLNPTNDSAFTLRFHDPLTHEAIEADPFVLESYLSGASAKSTMTVQQMEANLGTRNSITFTWKERAELASVLNGGGEVPNPFTIQVSFADLAKWVFGFNLASGSPVLGPLDSLFDLETDSSVVLTDEKGATTIDYDIAGLTATLREIQDRGISYQVNSIHADDGAYSLTGSASKLTYRDGLVGTFDYRISGPGGEVDVTDSYDPSTGLKTTWKCP